MTRSSSRSFHILLPVRLSGNAMRMCHVHQGLSFGKCAREIITQSRSSRTRITADPTDGPSSKNTVTELTACGLWLPRYKAPCTPAATKLPARTNRAPLPSAVLSHPCRSAGMTSHPGDLEWSQHAVLGGVGRLCAYLTEQSLHCSSLPQPDALCRSLVGPRLTGTACGTTGRHSYPGLSAFRPGTQSHLRDAPLAPSAGFSSLQAVMCGVITR
jgi:hypothetical protein